MAEARYKREHRRTARLRKALQRSLDYYFSRVTIIITPEVGKRLGLARKAMKLSQIEMGKLLGVSQSEISRVEHLSKGDITYFPLTVEQFRAALSEHFDYVFRGALEHRYEQENENENGYLHNNLGRVRKRA